MNVESLSREKLKLNRAADEVHRYRAKNYYFAGSHDGARRAAVLYSLLGTCRLNKVNPWEWLSDVLVRVNVASDDTAVSLLPTNWEKNLLARGRTLMLSLL